MAREQGLSGRDPGVGGRRERPGISRPHLADARRGAPSPCAGRGRLKKRARQQTGREGAAERRTRKRRKTRRARERERTQKSGSFERRAECRARERQGLAAALLLPSGAVLPCPVDGAWHRSAHAPSAATGCAVSFRFLCLPPPLRPPAPLRLRCHRPVFCAHCRRGGSFSALPCGCSFSGISGGASSFSSPRVPPQPPCVLRGAPAPARRPCLARLLQSSPSRRTARRRSAPAWH